MVTHYICCTLVEQNVNLQIPVQALPEMGKHRSLLRPNICQFLSLSIRRPTFLNCIKLNLSPSLKALKLRSVRSGKSPSILSPLTTIGFCLRHELIFLLLYINMYLCSPLYSLIFAKRERERKGAPVKFATIFLHALLRAKYIYIRAGRVSPAGLEVRTQ